jgi:hypothetical protein
MNNRPFKVLGIQQIAVSGLDKTRLRSLWVDTLGLELSGTYQSESENVDEDIAVLGGGPLKVEVDLMQPLDPEVAEQPGRPVCARRNSQGRFRFRHLFHPSESQRRISYRWRRCIDRTGSGAARSA